MAAPERPRDRRSEIALALATAAQQWPQGAALCLAGRDLIGVTGAGITLLIGRQHQQQCASDDVVAALHELQFTLGEGPSIDASNLHHPVLEPDLAAGGVTRWPAMAKPAAEAGVAAVFAFPLEIGAARLGVLTLYGDRPAPLGGDRYDDAVMVARMTAETILALQAQAPPDTLARQLLEASTSHAEVHQASGMVSAQLNLTIGDAMVRLRAHAYATGQPLAVVASDIVARRLRLDP